MQYMRQSIFILCELNMVMLIEVDNVKGFQDFLPPESKKRREVREIIEKHFLLHGFLPVETPVIEYDELMRSDSLGEEDEAISNRFRLKDRGGRSLGLRYEFTFQLARILKQNPNIKLPFRRYQIGDVFRDEPAGPERFRQFTQCDADIIGESSLTAEFDIFLLLGDILSDLRIQADIFVNHRDLIRALLDSVQIGSHREVMREVDKLDKNGEDNVKSSLRRYADANQIMTLFKLFEKDLIFFERNAFDGAKELNALIRRCKKQHVSLTFSPHLMRGFGYYTGILFEVRPRGQQMSIAAGGRYDGVVGKYLRKEIPATGISFGLERMASASPLVTQITPRAILISLKQDLEVLALAKILRAAGISCITSFEKLSNALEYANALDVPYAVIVGEDEIAKKRYTLRDMHRSDEISLTEKQLIKMLSYQK